MTEEWYVKELLRRAPVLAFAKSLDGRYVFANDAWFVLARLGREQVLGRTDYELFDFATADAFVQNDKLVIERGSSVEAEETLPVDGHLVVGHSTKFPLRDAQGNICGVGGIVVDITARKAAQTALAASEQRYRQLIEHSPEAYVVLDLASGKFVHVNANAQRLFKLSEAELLQVGPADVSPPTQPDGRTTQLAARAHIEHAMGGGTPVFDWIHQAGDGELVPCKIWLSRVELPSGPGVRASILDMRESERLRSSMERMRAQLDGVQDALPQLIAVVDPSERRLIHCNRRYTQVLGQTPAVPLWESVAELCEQAQRGEPARADVRLETCTMGERYFEVNVSRFAGSAIGDSVRLLFVASDVTEQRELDLQLRQARRLESLGRLAGGVAHDFNNLLTVILGSVEFLEPALALDPTGQADLATLKDAAIQARGLTSQLLAFARADAGRVELVDVDALVVDSMRMLARLIGEDVHTALALDAPGAAVLIDRGQLLQIILNLAVNARDAMHGGGDLLLATRVVELSQLTPEAPAGLDAGRFVVLSVTDSGDGMSPETLEKAFEPFFTTKAVGAGTGLGLSTVHGIAQRSGGGVLLQSRVGHGTSASVWLPLHDSAATAPSVPPSRCVGEQRVVLLVDDEIAVGTIGARALREVGFVVHLADSPETALEIAQQLRRFDIVVTDVVMPTMSGLELVERLAGLIGSTPVLYVSGYAADVLASRGLAADQLNLLRKPFTPATLVRRVCAALGGTTSSIVQ